MQLRAQSQRSPEEGARHALFLDGVLASISESGAQFLPLYLVFLGASTTDLSLLSSGPALLGLFALLPGARLAGRARSPKRLVLWGGGGLGRVLLALMAIVALFLQGRFLIVALLILAVARHFVSMVAH